MWQSPHAQWADSLGAGVWEGSWVIESHLHMRKCKDIISWTSFPFYSGLSCSGCSWRLGGLQGHISVSSLPNQPMAPQRGRWGGTVCVARHVWLCNPMVGSLPGSSVPLGDCESSFSVWSCKELGELLGCTTCELWRTQHLTSPGLQFIWEKRTITVPDSEGVWN